MNCIQMKTLFVLIISFLSVNACSGQGLKRISKAELATILENPSDKLHVLNFWATWCGPCVSELPDFQKVILESDTSKIDFLFISLDFPSNAEQKLPPFLKKNNYNFKVVLMNETDYNSWIDLVDQDWQGSIPATLFFNHARNIHHLIPESIDKSRLEKTIHTLLLN